MKKIGAVTVLYKSSSVIDAFFNCLRSQNHEDYELIVYIIDNNSPDDSLLLSKKCAENFPFKIEFIENKQNLGIAPANNQGITKARSEGCDYILLLNNDIEFGPDAIKQMMQSALDNESDMVTPKIYFHGTNLLWMAGGGFNFLRGTPYHTAYGEEDRGQHDKIKKIKYAPTCFMLISGDVFEKTGLMYEPYFVYYDDTDFIYRANKSGFVLFYDPSILITHKVSTATGGDLNPFSIYYMTRNCIIFLRRNNRYLLRYLRLGIFVLTRFLKYLKYNNEQRTTLVKAMSDGIKYKFE